MTYMFFIIKGYPSHATVMLLGHKVSFLNTLYIIGVFIGPLAATE